MKINQLFKEKIEIELLMRLVNSFGLNDLNDKRHFSKYDLQQLNTVQQINDMRPCLEDVYLPCKARIYLTDICEKRAVTILKQMLRVHGYYLASREKNINNKKIIFYQIMCEKDRLEQPNMRHYTVTNLLQFN
jgi:hypothetical protein